MCTYWCTAGSDDREDCWGWCWVQWSLTCQVRSVSTTSVYSHSLQFWLHLPAYNWLYCWCSLHSVPPLQSLPPAPPDLLCLSVKTDWWPASSVCPPQGQDRGGAGQAAGVQEGRHSSSSLWLSSSLPCGHSHGDSACHAGQWPGQDMTHIITFSSHF